MRKTGISVTFGRFGAFPDLWRHTQREFLSVIIDLAYRSNETFCSRTHSFGWERLHRVSWRGRKVHRNGDYNAAHFEFCRIAWRPPGHPRRLSPAERVFFLNLHCCIHIDMDDMQLGLLLVLIRKVIRWMMCEMCLNALFCFLVQHVFFLFLRIYRSTQEDTRAVS